MVLHVQAKSYLPLLISRQHSGLKKIILSALLFGLSFRYSIYCGWFCLICWTPLFSALWHDQVTLLLSMLWALIYFFLCYDSVVFFCLQQTLVGAMWFVAYYLVYVGGALWLIAWIKKSTSYPLLIYALSASFVLTVFFYSITHYFFWGMSVFEGCMTQYPLLPLMESYIFRNLFRHSNKWFIFFSICFVNIGLWFFIRTLRRKTSIYALYTCFFIVIAILFFYSEKKKLLIPAELANFYYIQPHEQQSRRLETLREAIIAIQELGKECLIVTPESTLPLPLNTNQMIIDALCNNTLKKETKLFIGAHSFQNDTYGNSLYFFSECRITKIYSKTHLMIGTESSKKNQLIQKLFFKKTQEFSCEYGTGDSFFEHKNKQFLILICSELFCMSPKTTQKGDAFIFVNDSWAKPHFSRILFLCAVLDGLEHNRISLYVSHHFFGLIQREAIFKCIETHEPSLYLSLEQITNF